MQTLLKSLCWRFPELKKKFLKKWKSFVTKKMFGDGIRVQILEDCPGRNSKEICLFFYQIESVRLLYQVLDSALGYQF